MNIININDYKASPAPEFRRPIPVTIYQAEFIDNTPIKKKSAADPIKDISTINNVVDYLVSNSRYRDNLLFTMGINFGLRCGDLLTLKIGHILNPDRSFKTVFTLKEQKTNKVRTCYLNEAVMDAAERYLCSLCSELNLNNFLFISISNNNTADFYKTNSYKEHNDPICVYSVERMLKNVINRELGLNIHAGTHLMRKTFAYHVIMTAPDRSRAIEFLQKIFGHSSQAITLAYAGITSEEIKTTCQNLNLGRMNICYAAGLSSAV